MKSARMELTNEFRVSVPVEHAWEVLTDVGRIAPCLPGAELQEVEGDEYRGVVEVKVGPITAQYQGKAAFVERDEAARRAVLRAEGRDAGGQGDVDATITATLTPDGDDGTRVEVVTDLAITGKVAQFGRGVLADVGVKLLGQFVERLEADVLGSGGGIPSYSSGFPHQNAEAVEPVEPAVEYAEAVEPVEYVDLSEPTGGSVVRRVGPAVGAVLFLLWVFRRRRRKRR